MTHVIGVPCAAISRPNTTTVGVSPSSANYISTICVMPRTRNSTFAWRRGLAREGTGLVWKHLSSRCPCTSYVSIICAIRLAPHSPLLGGDEYLSRIYRVRSTLGIRIGIGWVIRGGGATHNKKQHWARAIPPCGYNTRSAATSR